MDQCRYRVVFDDFTKNHFIKNFRKKYKVRWLRTHDSIVSVCEHIQSVLRTGRADLISVVNNYGLVKLDFAIVGLKISPKASGNRCILLVDNEVRVVKILLVYAKTDIPSHNETRAWKNIIGEEFPEMKKVFNL